jgi:hypothetical protein
MEDTCANLFMFANRTTQDCDSKSQITSQDAYPKKKWEFDVFTKTKSVECVRTDSKAFNFFSFFFNSNWNFNLN